MDLEELFQNVRTRFLAYGDGDRSAIVSDQASEDADALWEQAMQPGGGIPVNVASLVGAVKWFRYKELPFTQSRADFHAAIWTFAQVIDAEPQAVPASAVPYVAAVRAYGADLDRHIAAAFAMVRRAVKGDDPGALDVGIYGLTQAADRGDADPSTRVDLLMALGAAMQIRWDELKDVADLNAAVNTRMTAYQLADQEDPRRTQILEDLARLFAYRYRRTGEAADLDRLIDVQQAQIAAKPGEPGDLLDLMAGLATSLSMRFDRSGATPDIDASLDLRRQMLDLTSLEWSGRWKLMVDVSATYLQRHAAIGDQSDLDAGIDAARQALRTAPEDAPERPHVIATLAEGFRRRFNGATDSAGSIDDLTEPIMLWRELLSIPDRTEAQQSEAADELSRLLYDRFRLSDRLEDLDEAIETARKATSHETTDELTTQAELERSGFAQFWLNLLLQARYLRSPADADFDATVDAGRASLEHPSSIDELRAEQYAATGRALWNRYLDARRHEDLDEAIVLTRAALDVPRADSDPVISDYAILSELLRLRFSLSRDVNDLHGAVASSRRAVEATGPGRPLRGYRLFTLGRLFRELSDATGSHEHLAESIGYFRQAVQEGADDADPGQYLDQLNNALQTQYEWTGSTERLHEAVTACLRAVDLTSVTSDDLACRLSNLGNALSYRARRLGHRADAWAAVEVLRRAVEVARPDDHELGMLNSNLASALLDCFQQVHDPELLDQAIIAGRAAMRTAPANQPQRTEYAAGLAGILHNRFRYTGSVSDLDEAIEVIREADRLGVQGRYGLAPATSTWAPASSAGTGPPATAGTRRMPQRCSRMWSPCRPYPARCVWPQPGSVPPP